MSQAEAGGKISNCDVCRLSKCSLKRGMYCMVGLKFLMVAVIEEAVHDYRTRSPLATPAYEPLGRRKCGRKPRDKWKTAHELLSGKSEGPGDMSMMEFFQKYLDTDARSMVRTGVLGTTDDEG